MLRLLGSLGLLFVVTSAPAWAARPLSATERIEMVRAIELIETTWKSGTASGKLRTLLDRGLLRAEDRWPSGFHGETSFPLFGKQTVTISSAIIPNPANRLYLIKGGDLNLFEDRVWLASILVHEWLHTTQSWIASRIHRFTGRLEPPAWRKQKEFLQALLARETDRSRSMRVETMIDRVDFELEELKHTH